jgi:CysZ protein
MIRAARGFWIYFRGLKLWASHRELWSLSIIPFLLDLICLIAGLFYTFTKGPLIVGHFLQRPDIWYKLILYYGALALTILSLFFAVVFVVFIVGNLLAFPFNGMMAEKTLLIMEAHSDEEKSWGSILKKTMRNTGAMFKKTLILLVAGVFIFAATLIPFLGLIGAALSIFLMAYDRVDYSFDHYRWSFKQRVSFVKSHLPEMIGFSVALGLTTVLPIINMLVMPGSVVAGASLVADIQKRNPSLERSHT